MAELQGLSPEKPLPARHRYRMASSYEPVSNPSDQKLVVTSFVKLVPPLNWTSDSDPANPQNWNTLNKIYHTIIPALFTFVVILATSTYVPAIPYVQREMDISHLGAVLGLSLYLLGVTIGPTLGSPISELFGRKPIYLVSLPILIGFQIAAAYAKSLATLLSCRFIAGLGGSLCIAVGGGTIADLWQMKGPGIFASLLYVLMPFLAPSFGPLIGAYIINTRDEWRWSLLIIAVIGGPIYFAAVFMKETSKDEILRNRFDDLGLRSQILSRPQARQVIWIMVSRTLTILLLEPIVLVLALYTSFGYAIIFIFFEIFPVMFLEIYNFSNKQVGLTFLSLMVGFLFAILNFAVFSGIAARRAERIGASPEQHMHCALLGSIMLPASLFWLAFTCKNDIHWIVPILAGIPFAWSTLNVFLSTLLYIMVIYPPRFTASAMAALGVLRYTFGAIFPLFADKMFEALGPKWTFILLRSISWVLMPVPWLLLKYGKTLRLKSRYV